MKPTLKTLTSIGSIENATSKPAGAGRLLCISIAFGFTPRPNEETRTD